MYLMRQEKSGRGGGFACFLTINPPVVNIAWGMSFINDPANGGGTI